MPGKIHSRPSDRLGRAHDASHYLLTFRSGGTSLSGQASTAGVLVDTRRNFRDIEVLDDGLRVRVQPGATVRAVNARLSPYKRKLGPDPASEAACTIGGVVANMANYTHFLIPTHGSHPGVRFGPDTQGGLSGSLRDR